MNADHEQVAHEIPAEDRDFPDEVNNARGASASGAAAAAAAGNDIGSNHLPANDHPGHAVDERRPPPGGNHVDGGPSNIIFEGSSYPNGQQYFPPFDHTGSSGMPFYPPAAFSPVNPVPPIMLPHPHPSPLSLPLPAGGPTTNLDATRQFYEARMREHAVQYANAAACASAAAWAMAGMSMGNAGQSYYTLAPPDGWVEGGNAAGNGQKRTLWEPPSNDGNQRESKAARTKSGYQQSNTSVEAKPADNRAGRSENKKRNKKRESNDSVSSLGSESHDHQKATGKKPTKKGRRRFKEEPGQAKNPPGAKGSDNGQKRGLSHGHSSKSSFSSLGSNNKPPRRNKKNKSAQQQSHHGTTFSGTSLSGLIGKNATCALNELCAKYKWQSPQYVVEEATNTKDDYLTVMTVRVNNVDLGKGSGSNKAIARQDASRRALAALLPGVVFDPNGILQDVGRGNLVPNMLAQQGSMSAMSSLSADELGQQVASQLSIGGARKPTYAEDSDSSISTAFGSHNEAEGNVFSGGPLSQGLSHGKHLVCHNQSGRPALSSSYHASTSGMSSASDVDADDDNAFYASRGASVCSTLLHAMWQIDERIKQPPSYEFMANNKRIDPLPRNNKKSKRKKDENSDGEGAQSAARNPLATRSPFVCTCILNVYFRKDVVDGKDAMSCWESPLDFLQVDECQQSDDQCDPTSTGRKRKDALSANLSPHCSTSVEEDVEHDGSEEHPPPADKTQEYSEKFVLRGVGTGNTKREAKHKSSANMLALLFPNCRGLVEVKAAAEAARECYASRKAKRARLELEGDGEYRKKRSESFSLHELTLSEGSIKWKKPSHDTKSEIWQEVDAALQSLLDGKVKTSSIEDIGKIILRRAGEEDADYVHALLSKEASESSMPAKKQRLSSGDSDCDEQTSEGLLDEEKKLTPRDALCNKTIILVLSRAIALRDPPLGCAILRLGSADEKTISLVRLECETHVPRERFVDCLEKFSFSLDCTLDSSRQGPIKALSLPSIRSFLSNSTTNNIHHGKGPPCGGTMPPSQLQSVKEEESEEVDESCNEEEKSPLKKVKRSRVT